jgi:hypothetical protein
VIGSDDVAYVGGTARLTTGTRRPARWSTRPARTVGADAGNYVVNTTASATASITPAALTIAAPPTLKLRWHRHGGGDADGNGPGGGDTATVE